MKRVISAFAVLAIVSSALAFKVKSDVNLLICRTSDNTCQEQTSTIYSSTPNGSPVSPTVSLFSGSIDAQCGSAECPKFTGAVYQNQ